MRTPKSPTRRRLLLPPSNHLPYPPLSPYKNLAGAAATPHPTLHRLWRRRKLTLARAARRLPPSPEEIASLVSHATLPYSPFFAESVGEDALVFCPRRRTSRSIEGFSCKFSRRRPSSSVRLIIPCLLSDVLQRVPFLRVLIPWLLGLVAPERIRVVTIKSTHRHSPSAAAKPRHPSSPEPLHRRCSKRLPVSSRVFAL